MRTKASSVFMPVYGFQFSERLDILRVTLGVCAALRGRADRVKPELTRREVEVMLLTIAAESSFKQRAQIGGGPARGLCGMEPDTALDTFRYLGSKPGLWHKFTVIWFGLSSVPFFIPTKEELSRHLMTNDVFALALARIHYRMFPEPFPRTLEGQARYWKEYWNTAAGKGTPEYAVKQWRDCDCDNLMEIAERMADLRAEEESDSG